MATPRTDTTATVGPAAAVATAYTSALRTGMTAEHNPKPRAAKATRTRCQVIAAAQEKVTQGDRASEVLTGALGRSRVGTRASQAAGTLRQTGSRSGAAPATQRPGGQGSSHLLQLGLGGHLLGDERGLDPVEEALEPADQLGLGDPQLGIARSLLLERLHEPVELLVQLRGQTVLQLGDRRVVDLGEPGATLVVEWRAADLFEELLDHRADPHHLGRLLDEVGGVVRAPGPVVVVSGVRVLRDAHPVRRDHGDPLAVARDRGPDALLLLVVLVGRALAGLLRVLAHPLILPHRHTGQAMPIRALRVSRLSSNRFAWVSRVSIRLAIAWRAVSPVSSRPSMSQIFQNRRTGATTSSRWIRRS